MGAPLLAEAYCDLRPRPSLAVRSASELERLELRLLDAEARRFRRAVRRARSGQDVLLDTGFLGPLTYTAALVRRGLASLPLLERLGARAELLLGEGRWGLPDLILYLETPAGERARRVAGDPVGHPRSLAARHEAAGRLEHELYRRRLAPRLGRRLRWVPGGGPPGAVTERLLRALARRPIRPTGPAIARAILRALAPRDRPRATGGGRRGAPPRPPGSRAREKG